jgi:hypothetical protein
MKGKRHFTSVPPPEISKTIRHLEVSLPYSPRTALFLHPECHAVRTLYPTTKYAHLTRIRRRADWYISTHIPQNIVVCIRALFILGRRHVCGYKGDVSEETAASNFRVIFVGWDTSSYRTAHHGLVHKQITKKAARLLYPSSSHYKTALPLFQSLRDCSVLHSQSRDSALDLATVQCAANTLTTATAWREL